MALSFHDRWTQIKARREAEMAAARSTLPSDERQHDYRAASFSLPTKTSPGRNTSPRCKPLPSMDQLVMRLSDNNLEMEARDREWRIARQKAYAENPTAFKENSRFNSWGR
jgi:hypothetical protein